MLKRVGVAMRHMSSSPGECTQVFELQLLHDYNSDLELGVVLAEGMATVTGESIEELPPLGHSVDVGAVEEMFCPVGGEGRGVGCVMFQYYGHQICVYSSGRIDFFSLCGT